MWQKIVALAGGKGARIAVLPTAAGNPEREGGMAAANLNRHGAQAFVVPLAPRLAGSDVRKAADDPALAQAVRAAGGVFFTGGDQARITGALRRPDGSNSAVLDALWALYRRGGVIAGTSAGAAIMSRTMFYDPPPDVLPLLKHGVVDGKDIAPGLGFIGDDVFVDQHLLARGRFARMLPAMLSKGYTLGLGIDEDTAMVVAPTREVSVIGRTGAIVLDLGDAVTDKTRAQFNLSNARISYLDNGDRFEPRAARIRSRAGQGAGRKDGGGAPRRPVLSRHPGQYGGPRPAGQTGRQRPAARHRPRLRRAGQPCAGTRFRIHFYPHA